MSVRQHVYNTINHPTVTTILASGAAGIHAGGSLQGSEHPRPYIVYRVQTSAAELRGDDAEAGITTSVEVWCYDEPGTYKNIENVLEAVRARFNASEVLRALWQGDSVELGDDEQKAILKYASFAVAERVMAA